MSATYPSARRTRTRPAAVVAEDVEFLLDVDPTARVGHIATRLGFANRSSIWHALGRAGRRDLLDHLARNSDIARRHA